MNMLLEILLKPQTPTTETKNKYCHFGRKLLLVRYFSVNLAIIIYVDNEVQFIPISLQVSFFAITVCLIYRNVEINCFEVFHIRIVQCSPCFSSILSFFFS